MTDWFLTLFYFFVFLFVIRRCEFFLPYGISFSLAATVFTIKVICGILFGYVYMYYYKGEGDTFKFFADGNTLNSFFFSHPVDYFRVLFGISPDSIYFQENYHRILIYWNNMPFDFFFNDSRFIIRISSVIRFFSFGVYNVHVVFFAFLSFAGLTALYRFLSQAIKNNQRIFYLGIFLLPSVAFWGSGLIKETLVIFALGLLLFFIMKFRERKTIASLTLMLLFSFLLVLSKFYYIIALLPGMAAMLWSSNEKNVLQKFVVTHIVWLVILFSVKFIVPDYDPAIIISYKQNNFVNMAEASNTGSLMSAEKLQPYWSDLLLKAPEAFLIALISPFNFFTGKCFTAFASLETLFILLLIVLAIVFFRKAEPHNYPLLLFSLSFCVITLTLLGLSVPVAGALVRYKIITLPFLMFIILSLTDISKIKKLFSLS